MNTRISKIKIYGVFVPFVETKLITKKVSYEYPYDRTFGNPFARFPNYHVKMIDNNHVYFSYKKKAILFMTNCRKESHFLTKVLNSKLYYNLIVYDKVDICNLKFPAYNKFHSCQNIEKFLKHIFSL